jgi:vacuolar-type H+-ATPase subunit I/STV1
MEGRMMMTAEEAAEAAKGLTFEKVWAMFQETDKQIKEMSKEADLRRAEIDRQQEETGRLIEEMSRKADLRQEETSRVVKELSKNIGGLNNSFGRWAEEMVSAKLWEKFRALGYTFTQGGPREFWENDRMVAQVDMMLENGDYVMLVEIKSNLTAEDADRHIERIGKTREQLDKRGDRRKLVGAAAGMVVTKEAREYAQRKGLYVLVQSGDTVAVAEAPEGFKVREW